MHIHVPGSIEITTFSVFRILENNIEEDMNIRNGSEIEYTSIADLFRGHESIIWPLLVAHHFHPNTRCHIPCHSPSAIPEFVPFANYPPVGLEMPIVL